MINRSYEECVVNQVNIKNAVTSLKPDNSNGDVGLCQIILNMGEIYCVIIYQNYVCVWAQS